MRYLALAFSAFLSVACGPRVPGPADGEFGEIFFWRVDAPFEAEFQNCTDRLADRFEVPTVAANTFVLYEVANDGNSALSMECDSTDGSTCTDGPLTYTVSDHKISAELPAEPVDIEGVDCQLSIVQTLTYTDRGASLDIEALQALSLIGSPSACQQIEAAEEASSGNGEGFEGCAVTLTTTAEFIRTDTR